MVEGLFRFLVFKLWDFGAVAVLVAIVRRKQLISLPPQETECQIAFVLHSSNLRGYA